MRLILFDIDGTLIDSGGAGTRSLNLAFRELFSIQSAFIGINMAGKTDLQIIKECLAVHGVQSGSSAIPEVMGAYLRHLRKEIQNDKKHMKPGVPGVLHALGKENGLYCSGLLTGNIEQGARIKLESFGLNAYFPSGAFGSDHEDRNKLLPVALRRFAEMGNKGIAYRDCVVVGDTPRDVFCAKPYGAFCIGVATGPYAAGELVEAGADVVFEDLSDTGAFLRAVEARSFSGTLPV